MEVGRNVEVCINFWDVNCALPQINQLVDSRSGYELLSMMDVSQGYHQIHLTEDHKRVSFVIST